MFENYPDIIKIDHLTKMLNIGRSSAYALLQNNQIQHVKVGKKYIIPKTAVIGFINNTCYNNDQIISNGLSLVMKGDFEQ